MKNHLGLVECSVFTKWQRWVSGPKMAIRCQWWFFSARVSLIISTYWNQSLCFITSLCVREKCHCQYSLQQRPCLWKIHKWHFEWFVIRSTFQHWETTKLKYFSFLWKANWNSSTPILISACKLNRVGFSFKCTECQLQKLNHSMCTVNPTTHVRLQPSQIHA